jgi:hypothetical protein
MADGTEPLPRWVIGAVIIPLLAVILGFFLNSRDGSGDKVGSTTQSDGSGDKVSSATQVRACMTQHKMDDSETMTTRPPTTNEYGSTEYVTAYKKCVWPPPSWASPDGYSEIRVTETDGPTEGEAGGTNVADIIKSRCSELYVRYSLVAQGIQEPDPPFTSKPNRVVLYDGKEYHGTGLPYYKPDELVVLRNMKHRLDEVRCEE